MTSLLPHPHFAVIVTSSTVVETKSVCGVQVTLAPPVVGENVPFVASQAIVLSYPVGSVVAEKPALPFLQMTAVVGETAFIWKTVIDVVSPKLKACPLASVPAADTLMEMVPLAEVESPSDAEVPSTVTVCGEDVPRGAPVAVIVIEATGGLQLSEAETVRPAPLHTAPPLASGGVLL